MNNRIYVASRASIPERAAMWRKLRDDYGYPIVSTWIDEDGPGQTADMAELWDRIHEEIITARSLILYAEPGDFPLKGALVEVGIAIGEGKSVYVVLPGVELEQPSMRPIGSWVKHFMVRIVPTLETALDLACGVGTASPAQLAAFLDAARPETEELS